MGFGAAAHVSLTLLLHSIITVAHYIAARMSIAIADALLIEATIFLGFGVIVGFVLFAKFVKKDPWTSGI